MSIQICDYKLPSGDRSKQRESLIKCFLNECAGTGKGDYASRYQYNVEIYGEYGIYLKRPTQLNKGFDFTVNLKIFFSILLHLCLYLLYIEVKSILS